VWSAGNRRAARLDIHVSRHGVVLDRGPDAARWFHRESVLETALQMLTQELAGSDKPGHAAVWLSASLCRPVRVPAIDGAASASERERIAQTVALAESGLVPPCRVIVDSAGGQGETVAIVVEARVLDAIERAMKACRVRIVSIRPWWAEVLSGVLDARSDMQSLAVWEDDTLLTMTGARGEFSAVQVLHPVSDEGAAAGAFARSLVSSMVPTDSALGVTLDWQVEPSVPAQAWATRLPFAWAVRRLGDPS
jgi:hypothetical protein